MIGGSVPVSSRGRPNGGGGVADSGFSVKSTVAAVKQKIMAINA
ncbi:MAG: hypothetical protein WAZ14_04135 [Patescibacteria group bacterium]